MSRLRYNTFVVLIVVVSAIAMWLVAFDVCHIAGISLLVMSFASALVLPKICKITRNFNSQSTLLLDILIGISACTMMLDNEASEAWITVAATSAFSFVVADVATWLFSDKLLVEVDGVKAVPYILESIIVISMSAWLIIHFIDKPICIQHIALFFVLAIAFLFSLATLVCSFDKRKFVFKEFRLGLSLDVVLTCFLLAEIVMKGLTDDSSLFNVFVITLLVADAIRAIVVR